MAAPRMAILLDDLLTDTGSGHNIVATVYMEASSMYRDGGPEEMRPVGEVEFANWVTPSESYSRERSKP